MEACLSAHFVNRALRQLIHQPRIIPAIYVKPFVGGQRNDYNDAAAITEAALRANLPVVREKTQDQIDLQALHRVRSRLSRDGLRRSKSDPRFPDRARHCGQDWSDSSRIALSVLRNLRVFPARRITIGASAS
jgi:hypothetical protein